MNVPVRDDLAFALHFKFFSLSVTLSSLQLTQSHTVRMTRTCIRMEHKTFPTRHSTALLWPSRRSRTVRATSTRQALRRQHIGMMRHSGRACRIFIELETEMSSAKSTSVIWDLILAIFTCV